MRTPLRLEHPLCTVRPYRRGDETSVSRHANSLAIARNMRDRFPHPYTLADAERWIGLVLAQVPQTSWTIDVQGEAVGGIGLIPQDDIHRRSAEIGYWLGEAYWGRGIMTSVVPAVTQDAFVRFDLTRIYATVFAWNPTSARVLEKAGYTLEGRLRASVTKLGQTVDELLYACIRA